MSNAENMSSGWLPHPPADGRGNRRPRRRAWLVVVITAAMITVAAVNAHQFLYGSTPVLRVGVSPGPLAVSPDGRTVYLADSTDAITPVSAATGKAGKPIAISGGSPCYFPGGTSMAITPDGGTLFALVYSPSGNPRPLARVNLRTDRETGQIRLPGGAADFAMSRDGRTLYIVTGKSTLIAVNAATSHPERKIPALRRLLDSENAMALSPDGATLYVATASMTALSAGGGAVTPVSLRTGAPGRAVSVGWEPVSLAITPDGHTLYAAIDGMEGDNGQAAPNRVKVIDTAAGRVRASLPWQVPPQYLRMAPSGDTVWVVSIIGDRASTADDTVTPVSVANDQPGSPFRTSGWLNYGQDGPSGIAISPDSKTLYVTVPSGLETFHPHVPSAPVVLAI